MSTSDYLLRTAYLPSRPIFTTFSTTNQPHTLCRWTSQHQANSLIAGSNSCEDAKDLIKAVENNINDATSYGWTPLLFAASRNHTSTAELLLEQGATVCVSNTLGCGPLRVAAGYRSDFNCGAPSEEDIEKTTLESDNPAIIELLTQHGAHVMESAPEHFALNLPEDGERLQKNVQELRDTKPQATSTSSRPILPIHVAAEVGNFKNL